jgi:hypothetical protein
MVKRARDVSWRIHMFGWETNLKESVKLAKSRPASGRVNREN